MGQTTTFRVNGWTLADVTSVSCILQLLSVDQSGGIRMDIGVLYLSHAMLVIAESIVCSMRGFACILAKWFGLWKFVSPLHMEVPRPHVISEPTHT